MSQASTVVSTLPENSCPPGPKVRVVGRSRWPLYSFRFVHVARKRVERLGCRGSWRSVQIRGEVLGSAGGGYVKPVTAPDPKRIQRLLADLDSEEFTVRKRTSDELEKIGEPGVPALRKALEGEPSTEARKRIEEVLKKTENLAPRGELLSLEAGAAPRPEFLRPRPATQELTVGGEHLAPGCRKPDRTRGSAPSGPQIDRGREAACHRCKSCRWPRPLSPVQARPDASWQYTQLQLQRHTKFGVGAACGWLWRL
jgi:hypothetical protein